MKKSTFWGGIESHGKGGSSGFFIGKLTGDSAPGRPSGSPASEGHCIVLKGPGSEVKLWV